MKTEYVLEGLHCANCGQKILTALRKHEGVLDAELNFVSSALSVDWADSPLSLGEISAIVRRFESGIVVKNKDAQLSSPVKKTGRLADKLLIARLVLGAVFLAVGLVLEHIFSANRYILLSIFLVGYVILGGDVLYRAGRNIVRGRVFDENFLMAIATIGAFIIGEYAEGVGVMLFYQTGEFFQSLAVSRAKKSISTLMDIRPDYANLFKNGEIVRVAPQSVKIGEVIVVRAGEKIPLDGIVDSGTSMLDTAALSGESRPRSAKIGDEVLSGSVNLNGVLYIKTTKDFGESTVSKIIDLVENAAEKKAPVESFITKFARFYTPAVVIFAAALALLPPLFLGVGNPAIWTDWVRRGLIFLVISCPCALVISVPLSFFGGIGSASKRGVLVKGGNYLDALNHLEIAVFDKTGTLTQGVFEVVEITPANGFSTDQLLTAAACAESFSTHPIAASILKAFKASPDKSSLSDYSEIAGHGVSVLINKDSEYAKILTKPANFTGFDSNHTTQILAGNANLMAENGVSFTPSTLLGTKVYVAVGGVFAGAIVISDKIKDDSKSTIASLRASGIRTVMLTGDTHETAQAVADELGVDECFAGLLPHQKVEQLERLNQAKAKGGKLVFVGDGINDAPVLALADIGVSMGGLGSDAAIEAADIIIMNDQPSGLLLARATAKFTRRIVWQNIIFALGIKAVFLLLGAFGIATMWQAVFADVGVSLLAVLNSIRAMKTKKTR